MILCELSFVEKTGQSDDFKSNIWLFSIWQSRVATFTKKKLFD